MEELEGIVQRMIDAGESEDAIAKVVQHYNDKLGKTSDPASVEATAGSENNTASSSETGLSESQNKVDEENTWIEDLFGEEKNAEDKLWGAVDFAGDILRSWDSGWQQGGTLDSALDLYNKGLENMTDKEKEELLADMNAAENMPRTQEMVDFDNKYADLIDKHGGIKAFFLGWKENPSVMAQYSSQSMAMMARSLENGESIKTALGAAATGFSAGYAASKYCKMIPGPIGKAISGISALQGAGGGLMGGISRTMEKGFTTMDLLNEKGLEIYGDKWTNATDEETLKMLEEMTSNKEMFDDIKSRAVARGNTIGFVDAVTGVFTIGVGSSVARRAATSRFSKITKPAAVVAAGATETAGGIVSEIGGQVAAEQDIDPKEYLIEGFADKTFTLTQAVKKGIRNNPKYSINGEVMNGKKFKETIMSLDDEAFVGGDFVIENSPVMNQIVENRKQDINIDLGYNIDIYIYIYRYKYRYRYRKPVRLSGYPGQV